MADFEPVLERDDDPRPDNLDPNPDPGVGPDPILDSGLGVTPALTVAPVGIAGGDDLSAGPAAETPDTPEDTPFVFEFDDSVILPGGGFNYEFGMFY